jgi:hypothetical protein
MNALPCSVVRSFPRLSSVRLNSNENHQTLASQEIATSNPKKTTAEIAGCFLNRRSVSSTSRVSGLCLALLLGLTPMTMAQPFSLELPGVMGEGLPSVAANTPAVAFAQPTTIENEIQIGLAAGLRSDQDPLISPFPVPWTWIWEMQAQASAANRAKSYQYRSPEVVSPDGQFRAYTMIELEAQPDPLKSQVRSTLWVLPANGAEPLRYASSMHLGAGGTVQTSAKQPGTISMLMPIGWSQDGRQLLIRQFEALMGSDIASDYGVIWSRDRQTVTSWAPNPINYDSAVLLGWDQTQPGQILFETSILGELDTQRVGVNLGSGKTALTPNHEPVNHGQVISREAGPIQS